LHSSLKELFRVFIYSKNVTHFRKRKLTTALRHEQLMTGGDPAPVQETDAVMAFMDTTNSNIDIEVDCPYDSTAVFEKESKY